jgi:hypothetical protein
LIFVEARCWQQISHHWLLVWAEACREDFFGAVTLERTRRSSALDEISGGELTPKDVPKTLLAKKSNIHCRRAKAFCA